MILEHLYTFLLTRQQMMMWGAFDGPGRVGAGVCN